MRLVADAGGTNVRFALADASGGLHRLLTYQVEDFPSFGAALDCYLSDASGWKDFSACSIAAAGPVDGDVVKLTNNAWTIDRAALSALMPGIPVTLVNDLEAVAAALPHLAVGDWVALGEPPPVRPEYRPMLAMNVGTGFGAASVIRRGVRWWTCPSEAGHMSLSRPGGEEFDLLPSDATVESVLSGNGTMRLYLQLARDGRSEPKARDAAEVFALVDGDQAAAEAVRLVAALLGRIAGDLVLAAGAWGGLYLCGSVASGWSAMGQIDRFRAEFVRKGPMRERMERVATAVIRRENVSLYGLAMLPVSR